MKQDDNGLSFCIGAENGSGHQQQTWVQSESFFFLFYFSVIGSLVELNWVYLRFSSHVHFSIWNTIFAVAKTTFIVCLVSWIPFLFCAVWNDLKSLETEVFHLKKDNVSKTSANNCDSAAEWNAGWLSVDCCGWTWTCYCVQFSAAYVYTMAHKKLTPEHNIKHKSAACTHF